MYRAHIARQGKARLLARDRSKACKVILGAGYSPMEGWYATDIEFLNLLKEEDWRSYFDPGSIDAMLAEHVWEHLTPTDGKLAAEMCFRYLRPGGYLRLAVPDGWHPDPSYIEYVRPGGAGVGADDHKVLYTQQSMDAMLRSAGFEPKWLEFFDADHQFQYTEWDPADGMVHRSKRFDTRNNGGNLAYTSLIVDAIKPAA